MSTQQMIPPTALSFTRTTPPTDPLFSQTTVITRRKKSTKENAQVKLNLKNKMKDLRKEMKELKEREKNIKKEMEECKKEQICLIIKPIYIQPSNLVVTDKIKSLEVGALVMEKFLNEYLKKFDYDSIFKASVFNFPFMEDKKEILSLFENLHDKRSTKFWNLMHYNSVNVCNLMTPYIIRFLKYIRFQWNRVWRPVLIERTNNDSYMIIMSYLIPI